MKYTRSSPPGRFAIIIQFCLLCLAFGPELLATDPDVDVANTLDKILAAIETNNFESFIADGNATFKAGGTKEILQATSKLMAPRLKAGCEKTYLAHLKQKGFDVYVWKLTFKDGGDDILAKLVMQDGKVGGFWLQ